MRPKYPENDQSKKPDEEEEGAKSIAGSPNVTLH